MSAFELDEKDLDGGWLQSLVDTNQLKSFKYKDGRIAIQTRKPPRDNNESKEGRSNNGPAVQGYEERNK